MEVIMTLVSNVSHLPIHILFKFYNNVVFKSNDVDVLKLTGVLIMGVSLEIFNNKRL